MKDYRTQMASEFEQYQSLTTDKEQAAFWDNVAKRSEKMSADQRLAFQGAVREQVDKMLHRLEAITTILASSKQGVTD